MCGQSWQRRLSHPAQSLQSRSSRFTHTVRNAASRNSGCLGRALGKQRVLIKTTLQASGSPPARCRFPKACAVVLAGLPSPPRPAAPHPPNKHRHPNKHDNFDLHLHPQDGAWHHKIRRIVLARLRQLAGREDRARDRLAVGISGSASARRGFPEHSTFLLHPAPVPLPLPVAAGKSFSISGHRAPGGRQ